MISYCPGYLLKAKCWYFLLAARYAEDYEYKKGNLPIQKLRKLIVPLRRMATGGV